MASPYRAAYSGSAGNQFSSAVSPLPRYAVVEFESNQIPIDVTDSGFVLLQDGGTLLRWRSGDIEELQVATGMYLTWGAWITSEGMVVANAASDDGTFEGPIYWNLDSVTHQTLSTPIQTGAGGNEVWSSIVDVSPSGVCMLWTNETQPYSYPVDCGQYYTHICSDVANPSWQQLSYFQSCFNAETEESTESGTIVSGYGLNDAGDFVGDFYVASSGSSFFGMNGFPDSLFEPYMVNNNRVVLGISDDALEDLMINDKWGERSLLRPGTLWEGWISGITSPLDGLEEVVAGSDYFKRMTQRDSNGDPTNLPSPDFQQAKLDDLIPENSGWSDLYANAMSPNGFIVGEGTYTDPQTGLSDLRGFLLLKVDLVPDYDRDGSIRRQAWTDGDGKTHTSDYQRAADDELFYFWINDDNDEGSSEESGNDIPGSATPDSSRPVVDGTRDLVDYFPLLIDLHGYLDLLDLADVELAFLGPAVNYVSPVDLEATGLDKDNIGGYLRDVPTAQVLGSVVKNPGSVPFSSEVLEKIKEGNGIFLMDAVSANIESPDQPLRLVLDYNGNRLLDIEIPVVFSLVEDMYRHLDLRPWATEGGNSPYSLGTLIEEPIGWPEGVDGPANDKHFIFLHGYRVDGEDARGTFAEVFKRMYQSGSNAKFTGVTWYGDASLGNDYWENVIHAFESSEVLKNVLTNNAVFSGPLVIAAHSLGNMVVSSALADHGLSVDNYFMLDAAVAKEAYDSLLNSGEQGLMRGPNWEHTSEGLYDWRLLASHWHLLFKDGGSPFGASLDERSQLTWRGRFGILPEAHNFFSSTENVLKNSEGSNPGTDPLFNNGGELAWVAQEMNKGLTNLVTILNNDSHGGWGFNSTPASFPDGWSVSNLGTWRIMTPSEFAALGLSNSDREDALRTMPFFRQFKSSDSDYPLYNTNGLYEDLGNGSIGASNDQKYMTRAKILAEAIPALSFAAGSNEIQDMDILAGEDRNIDMYFELRTGTTWPGERPDDDWLHGDFKDIAYPYVYNLYDRFVEIGNLN
jgi:hypothetical protein